PTSAITPSRTRTSAVNAGAPVPSITCPPRISASLTGPCCTRAGGMVDCAAMGMLDGRVAIVTGGGRGLGRAHCLELARHGASVVVNDLGVGLRGDTVGESPAEEVVTEIKKLGGTA